MIRDKAIRYTRALDEYQKQLNRLVAFKKLAHKRIHVQDFLNDPEIAEVIEKAFWRLYINPANAALTLAEQDLVP